MAGRFNVNCFGWHIRMTTRRPGSWWEQLWQSRTPSYSGQPAWYHAWGTTRLGDSGAPRFLGYLFVDNRTAKMISHSCKNTNVITRFGKPA
jgi:hypothetical protein